MTTGTKASARGVRVWPGIVAPLGLTLLLGVASWLFVSKVAADRKRAEAASLRLEGYARLEAGDIAARARDILQSFIDARVAARRNQEKNLRLEVRGIMDAVYRLLTAGMEKARTSTAARREVGEFPSGFDGVKNYLEIAASRTTADQTVAALRACSPELGALLPAGASLAVIENNFQELLSLGGGNVPGDAVGETMIREFIWDDGSRARHWTLQVRLGAPNDYPVPQAGELAAVLTEKLGSVHLEQASWRGWLVDASGQAAAHFPLAPESATAGGWNAAPPFIGTAREWMESDGRLIWLERAAPIANSELVPAVAVAIERPAPPPTLGDELWKDARWSLTLAALTLFSLGCWIWFARVMIAARRNESREHAAPLPQRSRLVRDASLSRAVPEVEGVIVADIDAGGDLRVEGLSERTAKRPQRQTIIPSGSLTRLQAIHRGGKGMRGSRVLDQARSQVLRELAGRVRPVPGEAAAPTRRPGGRKPDKLPDAAMGWRKVDE